MKSREWWVSAKPRNAPADGYKYLDRDHVRRQLRGLATISPGLVYWGHGNQKNTF